MENIIIMARYLDLFYILQKLTFLFLLWIYLNFGMDLEHNCI